MFDFLLKGFLPTILLSTLLMGSSFVSAAVLLVSGADALSLVSGTVTAYSNRSERVACSCASVFCVDRMGGTRR